jgi:hypothetical protein
MKKAFNAKAVHPLSVDIIKKYYDPDVDASLVLGRVRDRQQFIVAWKSRHKDSFVSAKSFVDEAAAREYFNEIVTDAHPFIPESLTRDFQKKAVYDWEDNDLLPRSRLVTEKDARTLIRKIAHDYKVPVPDLEWEEFTNVSGYDDDTIYMGARDNISLLHEMAHHIHEYKAIADDGLAPHSPGFVAFAIQLYHRYGNIDLQYLQKTAAVKDILGDRAASEPAATNENEKPKSAPHPWRRHGMPPQYAPGP